MNRIQTAVVIGGTSGLGRSIAEALAACGVKVTARPQPAGNRARKY